MGEAFASSARHFRALRWVWFGLLILGTFSPILGQTAASLHGIVSDAHGTPVASALVSLTAKDPATTLTAHTDAHGSYRFFPLGQGVYALHAEMAGFKVAAIPSIVIAPNENKIVDLTLERAGADAAASSEKPRFFDEPRFTVSGVTDTTSAGGHGSDPSIRASEGLARATASLGKTSATGDARATVEEQSLRERVQRDPKSFVANRDLGKMLLAEGKPTEALAYLDRAAALKPADEENAYDQALANFRAGNNDRAGQQARALLRQHGSPHDTAALHHLLAEVDERAGDSLEAVREYQRAAELDSTEANLFDWGAELLLHRAPVPALEVFRRGNQQYPRSIRMLIGAGAASFASGDLDHAVRQMSAAAALAPYDAAPYLSLGRIEMAQAAVPDELVALLRRFAAQHPEDAAANYYYAIALTKESSNSPDGDATAQAESLLRKAVAINPNFSAAHLQLGILYANRNDAAHAIDEYQRAIELSKSTGSPDASSDDGWQADLEEAHYRLAQAYRANDQPEKAKVELEIYEQMTRDSARKSGQGHDLRQFVYTLRDPAAKQ